MTCRLCLSGSEILIPIFDEQGSDTKGIAGVVAKYLNIELKMNDAVQDTKICVSCWANLDNFQKFCRLVEAKQCELKLLAKTEVEEVKDDAPASPETEVEMELEMHMDEAIDDEDKKSQRDVLMCVPEINDSQEDDLAEKDSESDAQQKKNNEVNEKKRKTRGRPRTKVVNEQKESVARGTHARKIGRPGKRDASSYEDEDRLISNHMQLICDECQSEQKTFYELKQHFKKEHNREGYAVCCNKRLYKKGLLVEHVHVHNNPDYFKCEDCGHVFADRVCLRNHTLLKHNNDGDLPFECKHCPKKFAKIYFLQRHALKHATGEEKIYHCLQCNKGYPSLSRLKGHLRNVHGDGGLKVCNHCGALVRGTAAFQRHLRIHEGVDHHGVQCEVCGQWLSDKYVLRLHMERHEDPKTYTCDLCGKEAPSRVAMNAHYRYHHTNAEPKHKCSVCDKAFKTPRSLREHIATHTGETLYTCTYCPKTFKCSSNLHSHRKWQHPVEWARDKQNPKTGSEEQRADNS